MAHRLALVLSPGFIGMIPPRPRELLLPLLVIRVVADDGGVAVVISELATQRTQGVLEEVHLVLKFCLQRKFEVVERVSLG